MTIPQSVIDWLLDSDPAIRWQVMRDILHESESTYELERARMIKTGWCAQLLKLQNEKGLWNNSLYNGKWISTTYTLYLLKLFGLQKNNRQAIAGCNKLLAQGLFDQKEIRFSRKQVQRDLGITALVLSLCSYFAVENEALLQIAGFLINEQNKNGNWLPYQSAEADRYTFETTLLVLEALYQYQTHFPDMSREEILFSVAKGQEFLLQHYLCLDNGKPMKKSWTTFAFPPYWFYDILTALDYFRIYRENHDPRIHMAIQFLLDQQTKDHVWLLGTPHPGRTFFVMEESGKPSRWNTIRALRILNWWERVTNTEVR